MSTLDDMLMLAEQQAERVLLGTREQLEPIWLMVTGKGEVEIIATPWNGDAQKYLAVEAMREVMSARQVTSYSLLVEAWFAHASPEEVQNNEYSGVRPRQRNDRRECVVAIASNHWGQTKHRQMEIIRDKQGNCQELRRLDSPDIRIISPLFDNLLVVKVPQ